MALLHQSICKTLVELLRTYKNLITLLIQFRKREKVEFTGDSLLLSGKGLWVCGWCANVLSTQD